MSWYGENDKLEDILRDIDSDHTPDSVCEDAVREAQERGVDCNQSGYINWNTVDED